MKITKQWLKKIIIEEMSHLEEVKNDAVQLATMQDQMDSINGSDDDKLIMSIGATCDQMIDPINRLSDASMQGALLQSLEGLKIIVGEIAQDIKSRGRQPSQMPQQHMGGIQQEEGGEGNV